MRFESHKEDLMEERLRNEKPLHSAPPGMTRRVLSGLEKTPQERDAGIVWPRFAIGFAALALATFIGFSLLRHQPQSEPVLAAQPRLPELPLVAVETRKIELPKVSAVQFEALSMQLDQPLEKELENVISDTRQAIQFVAATFLPE